MVFPEHLLSLSWQAKHEKATVASGATQYQPQSPQMFFLGKATKERDAAEKEADLIQQAWDSCPPHQRVALVLGW